MFRQASQSRRKRPPLYVTSQDDIKQSEGALIICLIASMGIINQHGTQLWTSGEIQYRAQQVKLPNRLIMVVGQLV